MKIHEYQARQIMKNFDVPVPVAEVASSPEEARKIAEEIGGKIWEVKSQIHAGGRGKGGGVKLARSLDEKDPWVLLSRPVQWDDALLEQSFGERTSERRARKTSYILLGAAVLSGLAFLLFGGGLNGMAAAMTAMLCMGAPLSSTLVAGLATLRLQKSAAAFGKFIPAITS